MTDRNIPSKKYTERWDAGCDSRPLLEEADRDIERLQRDYAEMEARCAAAIWLIPAETLAGDLQKLKDDFKRRLQNETPAGQEMERYRGALVRAHSLLMQGETTRVLQSIGDVLGLPPETGVSHMTSDETRTALGAEAPVPVASIAEGEALFRQRHQSSMSDEQIKHMVNRFLGWRLPENFSPDAGISFKPEYNVAYNAAQGKPPALFQPIGTNLFNAEQAEAMIRYLVDGLPPRTGGSRE